MRITRFPSISEPQFLGCVAAFVDSLTGELNSAMIALKRLEGKSKGAAFAYEMTLDTHRYGALIVLDRWFSVAGTFGPHVQLSQRESLISEAQARVKSAEEVLTRLNQLIDAAGAYSTEIVEAAGLAFQSVTATFAEERAAAAQSARLGPMLSDEYREARQIFLEDLAAR